MRIHRISLTNFRNFKSLDVQVGNQIVIAGENQIGKTNLLYALRLLLDPSLPDSVRQLRDTDFWDGLSDPIQNGEVIEISLEFTEFDGDEDLMAVLAEHLINPDPMISKLTFRFQPKPGLGRPPRSEADYEFITFGGGREDNQAGFETKRRIPFEYLHALRDAERDLAMWSQSPLRPLLDQATSQIDRDELAKIAESLLETTEAVLDIPGVHEGEPEVLPSQEVEEDQKDLQDEKPLRSLSERIMLRLTQMVGVGLDLDTTLGFSPTDPDRLIRAIRLFIDGGKRGLNDASLGSANLLYLTLKSLEIEYLARAGNRDFTFLAIEEPEAHLHPHLQRLVYREFLKKRQHLIGIEDPEPGNENQSIVLTTHSPHIVSVSPLRSIVLLRSSADGKHTEGVSASQLDLTEKEEKDIERYLDVNRGELVFSKGVILVEGSAEEFLIPAFGKLLGFNFDELGVSVCSVSGTNFDPYIKLLGENGLGIPFVIITDLDPRPEGAPLGVARVAKILSYLVATEVLSQVKDNEIAVFARDYGVFLNSDTLELELLNTSARETVLQTIIDISENGSAISRATEWKNDPSQIEEDRFISDIKEIGKGRFAQRLASSIPAEGCPDYIQEAIRFIATKN